MGVGDCRVFQGQQAPPVVDHDLSHDLAYLPRNAQPGGKKGCSVWELQ